MEDKSKIIFILTSVSLIIYIYIYRYEEWMDWQVRQKRF